MNILSNFCKSIPVLALAAVAFVGGSAGLNADQMPCPKYDQWHHLDIGPVTLTTTVDITSDAPSQALAYTPFATGPDGKVHVGETTVSIETNFALTDLIIEHPWKGSYVTGYFVSLPTGSTELTGGVTFAGWTSGQLDTFLEISPIPGTAVSATLLNGGAVFVISSNFEMKVPLPTSVVVL